MTSLSTSLNDSPLPSITHHRWPIQLKERWTMSLSRSEQCMLKHAQLMGLQPGKVTSGMDILIVSTNSRQQQAYWQKRLEMTRGQVAKEEACVVAIFEDWPQGAGNGLGSLYAYEKARAPLMELYGVDLDAAQKRGASIALYHTAGKGSRLAPLPGAEYNNKSAVKLPGFLFIQNSWTPITILEAVIRQTAPYASSRPGRLSVFWGDQIFIPSLSTDYTPKHHIDILGQFSPPPTEKQWQERGLHRYGLIARHSQGSGQQVEKITYPSMQKLLEEGHLNSKEGLGISLGAFSLSFSMTQFLLEEFAQELQEKRVQMESDYHFWMPLTLSWDAFSTVLEGKPFDLRHMCAHHHRMQLFKEKIAQHSPEMGLFGALDIGEESLWWDYGQVKHYIDNNLKILDRTFESQVMRQFFRMAEVPYQTGSSALDVDSCSRLLHCDIKRGKVERSLLIGVRAEEIQAKNSVMINTLVPSVHAHNCLLYNVVDDQNLQPKAGSVRADVFLPHSHHFKLYTTLERDGSKDWSSKILSNPVTYSHVHTLNQRVNQIKADRWALKLKRKIVTLQAREE